LVSVQARWPDAVLKLLPASGVGTAVDAAGREADAADPPRFEAFVREYQGLVFATATRLLGGSAEAEDVAQTVFLKAFERFEDIRANPAVAGWLRTVTTNLCLNHLTRYRARWQFFSELDDPEGGAPFAESIPATAPRTDGGEVEARAARLERALAALPDHQRVPIVLFHFEERSYQEIAALLGVSLGKVKTDIHRGRLGLLKVLDGLA
jgi:RNA polymerase sigma-70 factor (ECF subfamily)